MNRPSNDEILTPAEVLAYYGRGVEQARLSSGIGRLERIRMESLLARFLPPAPAIVLDVGGGPGHYACWLARRGYEVHLVDPVPLHIELAARSSKAQPDSPLATIRLGDARDLRMQDASVDALMLFGPLYHLPRREDRSRALAEARRTLRPAGTLMAIGISRFAALIDGLRRGALQTDPGLADFALRHLPGGRDIDREWRPGDFPAPSFHLPRELVDEAAEAGFRVEHLVAVEPLAAMLSDEAIEASARDHNDWTRLLGFLEAIEAEASILGATGHLLVVARKG